MAVFMGRLTVAFDEGLLRLQDTDGDRRGGGAIESVAE